MLPAVGPFAKQARTKQISSTSGALRYYEYTLLGARPQPRCSYLSAAPSTARVLTWCAPCGLCTDAGPSGEQCFLFHVVNPACTKHK